MRKVSFGGINIKGYEIISFLSRRAQTSIAKAKKDNKLYLLKITKKNTELHFINNISCSTIIAPYEYFLFQRHLVIVFELAHCDLYQFLQKNNTIPMNTTLQIMEDCFQALYYLHCEEIIHHDIKLENIVIFKNSQGTYHAKLISFSGAKSIDKEPICHCHFCTPGYYGPEFHEGHTYSTDIYSLGITLRYLWSRTQKTGDSVKIIDNILKRMILNDSDDRITAQECYSIIYYNVLQRHIQAQNNSINSTN
ncbi:hypothetical protein M9Y10_014157 [Tritrichomonas musculus]|uniref:Protein kinase domain-containing protein n=1 Tax=Tritrichomonas musculus TaxID=1915356 RepID=A0ABR2KYQ7_9EUKA